MHTDRSRLRLRWPAAGLLVLGACATAVPPPETQLAAARTAIATAERIDAGRYAGGELAAARDRLARADLAVRGADMDRAAWLADESRVEAELAAARTEALKAAAVNTEMARGADALNEELQRAGDQQ
jgi:hypothetical protein